MGKIISFPNAYSGEPALLEHSKTVNVYAIIREASEEIRALTIPEQAALLRTLASPEQPPEVFGGASEAYASILLSIIREKCFQGGDGL